MTYLNQYDINEENVYISELISTIFLSGGRHHFVDTISNIMNISGQELGHNELGPNELGPNELGPNELEDDIMYTMYPGVFMFDYQPIEDPLETALHESLQSYKHTERKPITLDVEPILYITTDKSVLACSICQDDFKDNNTVVILDCNHILHEKCISEWGKYKPECPNCKTPIKIREKQ
jgi:hypothetical protein